ncbi:MAG: TetR/AcrR family transcriptional regulator [Anaerolineales bacterium]|jgi:AcrR family transcriptional regulator
MARKRKAAVHAQMKADIKAAARRQMQAHGTAGLTLRGIARDLRITAPAIYHYFPSLDDLITSLIVDAFQGLADAMEQAGRQVVSVHYGEKIKATMLAYRQWAVTHPIDFQLIYGNPIPGYHAPAEVTAPLARQPFEWLGELMVQAWHSKELIIPAAYMLIPAGIQEHLEQFRAQTDLPLADEIIYLMVVGWSRSHGMVMLELFEHSQPVIGHPADFYEHETETFLASLGLQLQ